MMDAWRERVANLEDVEERSAGAGEPNEQGSGGESAMAHDEKELTAGDVDTPRRAKVSYGKKRAARASTTAHETTPTVRRTRAGLSKAAGRGQDRSPVKAATDKELDEEEEEEEEEEEVGLVVGLGNETVTESDEEPDVQAISTSQEPNDSADHCNACGNSLSARTSTEGINLLRHELEKGYERLNSKLDMLEETLRWLEDSVDGQVGSDVTAPPLGAALYSGLDGGRSSSRASRSGARAHPHLAKRPRTESEDNE
ncbi:hypothetical protein BD626DRAFT_576180 [Schizophyllum amplum]|uniref:Uncharacterized protein n=1 Tax=Schizophyllum amplum TaxID=97359 RepID=A0A550BTZ4_9AGAR|nr:hypothetical protein BD626DRAFT_576180 [Auriculariopsis ampla]